MIRKLLITLIFFLLSVPALAQSGKITGKVVDAETGEPLTGATVALKGTTRGSIVDLDGNYLLLNVAPGTYTLEARFIGYSTLTVEEVIVRTNLTTTQDFSMQLESFAGEELVVVAERKAVLKDVTSSESRVSSGEIEKLPVQEVGDIIQLQAGVNVDNGGGIHIRGGRTSEVSYVVDGIRVTDDYDRSQGVRIENESIQELQVISGSFNAEHGQALSGVINVVTKAGSNRFEASYRGWGGGYLTSDQDLYDGLANQISEFDPARMYNNSISVSGPIIKDKLTFFATARQFRNEGWLTARNARIHHGELPILAPVGADFNSFRTIFNQQVDFSKPWYTLLDTVNVGGMDQLLILDSGKRDSSVVDANRFESYSFQSNLEFRYSKALKFNFISSYGEENGRNYNHAGKLVPSGDPEFFNRNYSLNLKTTITPSERTFLTFNLANRFNKTKSYLYADAFDPRYFDQEVLSDYFNQFQDPEITSLLGGAPSAIFSPGGFQFNTRGTNTSRFFRSTNTFIAKGEISSQVTDRHFIKAGLNLQADIIDLESLNLQQLDENEGIIIPEDTPEELRPFVKMGIPPLDTPSHTKFTRKPYLLSGYIQDKIEYDNFIVNVGLRLDYFEPNAQIPADPNDPDIFNPTKPENQFRDENGNSQPDPGEEITLEERREFWFEDADPKFQLSPRFGIAYSINDAGVIYFSYGYFFQMPSFNFLYDNSQIILRQTSGVQDQIFGNPDLEPESSIQYEIGLKQEVLKGTAIELTGFIKDTRNYVTTGAPIPTGSSQIFYNKWINRDFSRSRGVTFAVNQTVSRRVNFSVDYTFSTVEGTNSDPAAEFIKQQQLAGGQPDTTGSTLTKLIQPLDWDRSHIVNSSFFYSGNSWGLNAVSRFLTGTPYTPDSNIPGVITGPVASNRDLRNSRRLPARFTLDINAFKDFRLSSNATLQVFLNVFNLFDIQNVNSVFTDSGEPDRPLEVAIGDNANPAFFDDPGRFDEPRRIQFGVELSF